MLRHPSSPEEPHRGLFIVLLALAIPTAPPRILIAVNEDILGIEPSDCSEFQDAGSSRVRVTLGKYLVTLGRLVP